MRLTKGVVLACTFGLLLVASCGTAVPKELADARAAYDRASKGPAAQTVPADLHKARESLAFAEQAFVDHPGAQHTRDLAYVAERRAQLAEALSSQFLDTKSKASSENQFQRDQTTLLANTKGELNRTSADLAESKRQGAVKSVQIDVEQQARIDAEQKAADSEQHARAMSEALAKLGAVKAEERGLVITLPGSDLFAADRAVLLPEAQLRLDHVTEALLASKERSLVVEGHTDSRGSDDQAIDLSQRRADAVRTYLVGRGYEADLIQAHGLGKLRPIASNSSAAGRANNRRVEIVVAAKKM